MSAPLRAKKVRKATVAFVYPGNLRGLYPSARGHLWVGTKKGTHQYTFIKLNQIN